MEASNDSDNVVKILSDSSFSLPKSDILTKEVISNDVHQPNESSPMLSELDKSESTIITVQSSILPPVEGCSFSADHVSDSTELSVLEKHKRSTSIRNQSSIESIEEGTNCPVEHQADTTEISYLCSTLTEAENLGIGLPVLNESLQDVTLQSVPFSQEHQPSELQEDSNIFNYEGECIPTDKASPCEIERAGESSQGIQDCIVPQYMFFDEPQLITGVWEEYQKSPEECFTKGCKWSPDGTCILTNSEDNLLRIFDLPRELHCQESWSEGRRLPELKPALLIKEGGRVYDYCWYPFMSSWNPLSCCLLSTSQFSPVHLWDAYTGQLRASYRSYNHVDEIEHAYSVAFNLTGEKLYCGFKKRLSIFHTASPGSDCENRSLKGLGRPVGIVSCICVNPTNESIFAFSSYSRTIGLCSEQDGQVICLLCNEGGGLTHIMFSPDGSRLYAGSRNDSQLFCWDMRNLGNVLFTAERTNNTNQRIYFDLTPDGRFLVSGSTDGLVHVWDTEESPDVTTDVPFLPVKTKFQAHIDCVNGLSLHKQYPVMATSSGQRHPYCPDCESDEESPPNKKKRHILREDSMKLWWLGRVVPPSSDPQS